MHCLGVMTNHPRALPSVTAALLIATSSLIGAQSSPALQQFEKNAAAYAQMQRKLKLETPGPKVASKAATITNDVDALAAAIIRARRGAKQGDVVTAEGAEEIRRRMRTLLGKQTTAAFLKELADEPTFKGKPAVHLRYPKGTSMFRMPARVLNALPELPEPLRYRFVGRDLVLRDTDAELIIDFIPDALP